MNIIKVIFWIAVFIIGWAMVGYNISLKVLGKLFKARHLEKDYSLKPMVSVMIVAHNEEKVIQCKLNNIVNNDYPKDKIEYIIASDFSTDETNDIVRKFILDHPELNMILHESKEHKGKTNAQNEAQKVSKGEILIMTDANAMFEKNSITELVASFTSEDIAYVTGRLSYINSADNTTASSESSYWEFDLSQRDVESRIKTITAGNGAIYACRNKEYIDFEPIECHDSSMPYYFGKRKMRAIYNPDAIAYEKAGEVDADEFKRKVRMNRRILHSLKLGVSCLNVFRYGWFSYFYFGHRTCRYLLWISHLIVLIASLLLIKVNLIYMIAFIGQILFYTCALINMKLHSNNKLIHLISYYTITILAQWKGVYNNLTGKAKPTWEKAESTR